MKLHISRLPIIPYSVPDTETDTRLAVSVPLFHSAFQWIPGGIEIDRFQNVHCRGAIWAAMALLHNTNLGRNGVKVYFHIEDTVWDAAMPVFKAFEVDGKWLRKVSVQGESDPDVGDVHYGKIYLGLLDDQINTDLLMIIDSDAFVCTSGVPLLWYHKLVSAPFMRNPAAFEYGLHEFEYKFWTEKCCHAAGLPYDPELPNHQQERRAYKTLGIPYPANSEKNAAERLTVIRPTLQNAYKMIPLKHKLRRIIAENVWRCYQSKFILGMYGVANPILQMSDILGVRMFNDRQHYEASKDEAYIHHVIFGADQCDSFFNRFYRDLTRNIPVPRSYLNEWRKIYGG